MATGQTPLVEVGKTASLTCPEQGSMNDKIDRSLTGVVALSVEYRTCDQEVGFESRPGTRRRNPGQVSHTCVPLFTKQLVPAKGR